MQYLVTEFVRFIMHTQHREVGLRSDLENPQTLHLQMQFAKHAEVWVSLCTMSQSSRVNIKAMELLSQLCSSYASRRGFSSIRSKKQLLVVV